MFWMLASSIYKAVKYGALLAKSIMVWAAAHAAAALVLGVGTVLAGNWLKGQSWAGSQVLGEVLGTLGMGLTMFALGAWVKGFQIGVPVKSIRSIPSVQKTISYVIGQLSFG